MFSKLLSTSRDICRQPNFVGLLGSTLSLGMAYSFFAPFISTWGTEEVGMSPTGFSLFMTCTSLCAILMGTLMGRLSDTVLVRRHVLIVAALGGTLGYLAYAFIRNPYILGLVGCTVLAISTGSFAQLFAHVREEYHKPLGGGLGVSLINSVVRVFFSFAWTVGPALGSLVLIAFGFKGLFSAAAALWGIFLLGVIFFVPRREHPPRTNQIKTDSIWRTFRRPDIVVCFVSFSVLFAAQAVNMMNLPLALVHILGGSEKDLGIVFGIGPLVEVPMMLWFGQLASRGHQLKLIRFGFLLALLYFVGLSFAQTPSHVYMLQVVSGIMVSISANVAIVFFQDLMPGQPGLATALFTNSQAAGNLLGMLSFGFLVEGFGYRGVFYACTAMTVLGIFLIMQYRQRQV
ncbi:MAG: sugar efflux transporter [Opitutales bacterium]|nr:sugar efflux transporter [Opitutales bacterium]